MTYALPGDVDQRPIAIDGAGTLGRRIAAVYAAGGTGVRIFDLSAEQRQAAVAYVEQPLADTQKTLGLQASSRGDRGRQDLARTGAAVRPEGCSPASRADVCLRRAEPAGGDPHRGGPGAALGSCEPSR